VAQRANIMIAVAAAVGVVAIGVAAILLRTDPNRPYEVTDFGPMTARELSSQSFQVVPDMLAKIYLAFAEVDEARIYDQLALVAADEALETLYLERVGAMNGGGLDEADQTLHEMTLANLSSRQNGMTLDIAAKWHVVGTVGHAEHMHVRGNTYSANLQIEPVGENWRMTAFELTDVDRSGAGTLVAADDAED